MSGTQVVTRSSPTEELPMAECVATKPAGAEKVPTPAGAQSTPIPEDNPGSSAFQFGEINGEINPTAANV